MVQCPLTISERSIRELGPSKAPRSNSGRDLGIFIQKNLFTDGKMPRAPLEKGPRQDETSLDMYWLVLVRVEAGLNQNNFLYDRVRIEIIIGW